VEPREKVNILLVDDQPGKLITYEVMLAELGENLIKANSGREALEVLLKTEITVILMDVSMPDLDGFELAEIIRQHPRYKKTAIIFVSAVHMSDVDRLRGYASGAVDYVSVPVVPEILRAKVSVFVELYRQTREAERLNRELEERVERRTAELQQAMSKQVDLSRQLREADRRKDDFLALLAHELRNPLASLRNAASIMSLKEIDDSELVWCRDMVDRQTCHLTRLVDDLLDVSRITQGKIALRRESVNLAEIVAGAVEISRPYIDTRGHELNVTLPDQPVMLHGDSARLIQIVANLLNNAAKFQNEHGRIELTVERDEDEVIFVIKDCGFGISSESLPRVFDLFAQGDHALQYPHGGLGIGLSLVKSLVGMHGGTVGVRSEGLGLGSEFTVRLPCQLAAEPATTSRVNAPTNGHGAPALRILVVDDNQDAALSLALFLRLSGHEVMLASEGETAVEIATKSAPEIVFLDIGLPGMDGYEVCRRIRAQGPEEIRIIAMTGYGQERDRLRTAAAGFDAHMVKPVEPGELLRQVAYFGEKSREARLAAGKPTVDRVDEKVTE
jgi:signal transduction histidine kinase